MDEETLQASLDLYKTQLSQVLQALLAAGENGDLKKLKDDLEELILITEESLLAVKKDALSDKIDRGFNHQVTAAEASSTTSVSQNEDDLDAEYAAFQAAIYGDDIKADEPSPPVTDNGSDDNTELSESLKETFSGLIGTRCRAPFSQDWGGYSFHNAMITEILPDPSCEDIPKVNVMFCNPTHASMMPCKYYLEGSCKFSDENCRFSHGYPVALEELREFIEPEHSTLKLGSKCLAKYDDGLWYKSMIVDITEELHHYIVTFDTYDETVNLTVEDILPLDLDAECDSSDGEEEARVPIAIEEDSDEDVLPVFLWKPPKTTDALGQWECHTRGIGSKIMQQMGYIVGQGLGKDGEGRAEPIPIQLLPQGKSLDKIMELKAIAGDQDLFDVLKKQQKKRKSSGKDGASSSKGSTKNKDVFDFLNKRLVGKKGKLSSLVNHKDNRKDKRPSTVISEQDLHKKSDRHLNVQILKTDEEIKNVEKEIVRLKQSIERNQREKGVVLQVKQKISSLENYLDSLKNSGKTMEQHRTKRKDSKKLMIF